MGPLTLERSATPARRSSSSTISTPRSRTPSPRRCGVEVVLDDQPVVLKTRTKTIVNVPYTQECNDIAMMLIQHHEAGEYYRRAMDQFEQLYADSRDSARVMALVVHPYVMGAPHRAKYYRRALQDIHAHKDVLFWTGEQILDWYLNH